MVKKQNSNKTFSVGVTMAGAVSAGAYTAGFMDYLMEVLSLWEAEKNKIKEKLNNNQTLTEQEKKIPLYDVKIEALGGASAGGMVGVMSALSLYKKQNPVKKPTDKKTGNILYDSWVLLDDDVENNITTFEKMLVNDDITQVSKGIESLLNSKPIDNIADGVFNSFKDKNKAEKFPAYISNDLRVLLTLCNLRGIPFEVNFQKTGSDSFEFAPGHRMNEHMLVANFKTNYNPSIDKNKYLEFNPFNKTSSELIKLCTKATGAFPIGLVARHFKGQISTAYVKNALLRSLRLKDVNAIDIKLKGEWYDFTDVDGGTINNEPYDEVLQALQEKVPNDNPKNPMTGILMIDPFPSFYNQDNPEDNINEEKGFFQKAVFSVIPQLIVTLIDQVRVKRMGLLYDNNFRVLAFPYKWQKKGVRADHPPLATSGIGGFGGFLDREFRKHDFFLGRNNARNMLNSYFTLKYDEENLHPLFEDLTPEMKKKFLNTNTNRFPIIPDVNKVLLGDEYPHPFEYDYKEYPKLDKSYLEKIRKPLKKRLHILVKTEINNNIENWFFRSFVQFLRRFLVGKVFKFIMKKLEKTLIDRKQL